MAADESDKMMVLYTHTLVVQTLRRLYIATASHSTEFLHALEHSTNWL